MREDESSLLRFLVSATDPSSATLSNLLHSLTIYRRAYGSALWILQEQKAPSRGWAARVIPVAEWFPDPLGDQWAEGAFGSCPAFRAVEAGQIVFSGPEETERDLIALRESLLQHKVRSVVSVPVDLPHDDRGVVEMYFRETVTPIEGSSLQLPSLLANLLLLTIQREFQLEERHQQSQLLEDIAHQLVGPVSGLRRRLDRMVGEVVSNDVRRELYALRGMSSKVARVVGSISIYDQIASGREIKINRERQTGDDILRLMVRAAQDQELVLDVRRGIHFSVWRGGALDERSWSYAFDVRLLEQMINNLLDNAGKYSFDNTTVVLVCEFNRRHDLVVSVINTGIPFRPSYFEKCRERGWRGEEAESVTSEGSGLGLWITDNLIRAHLGRLDFQSTNKPTGRTRVDLVFPKEFLQERRG